MRNALCLTLGALVLGGCVSMKSEEGVYVKDNLSNAAAYAKLGPNFEKAVAFLQRKDLMRLPNGRYELDGENAYAMVQEANLRVWGSGKPELHHKYFDIQLPLSGEETIGVGAFDPKIPGDFDEEKDCGFYDETPVEPLTLCPGEFAILHPKTCAHAPCCSEDAAGTTIRKIVVKVRADA